MRIAQVAPLVESVPPKAYGGTERVVSYLTEALVAMGHDVTLFASGDSVTTATLVPGVERATRLSARPEDWLAWTVLMLDRVFAIAERFDVVHCHVDYLHYPLARRSRTPWLTTLHNRQDIPHLEPLYRHFGDHPLISISDSQRAWLRSARWFATVHHGLPPDLYRFHESPEGYFAFVGRISREKRVDRAIEMAIACDVPLRIAAKVDAADQAYFEREIKHRLDHPLIEYVGEISDDEKNDFLGKAKALLFPIDWPEPFGLVMLEALACGTPVLAYACGAVPEILEHGVTGFVVRDQDEACCALREIDRLDRRRCRQEFERRFTSSVMAKRYLEVYEALARSTDPLPGA